MCSDKKRMTRRRTDKIRFSIVKKIIQEYACLFIENEFFKANLKCEFCFCAQLLTRCLPVLIDIVNFLRPIWSVNFVSVRSCPCTNRYSEIKVALNPTTYCNHVIVFPFVYFFFYNFVIKTPKDCQNLTHTCIFYPFLSYLSHPLFALPLSLQPPFHSLFPISLPLLYLFLSQQ